MVLTAIPTAIHGRLGVFARVHCGTDSLRVRIFGQRRTAADASPVTYKQVEQMILRISTSYSPGTAQTPTRRSLPQLLDRRYVCPTSQRTPQPPRAGLVGCGVDRPQVVGDLIPVPPARVARYPRRQRRDTCLRLPWARRRSRRRRRIGDGRRAGRVSAAVPTTPELHGPPQLAWQGALIGRLTAFDACRAGLELGLTPEGEGDEPRTGFHVHGGGCPARLIA